MQIYTTNKTNYNYDTSQTLTKWAFYCTESYRYGFQGQEKDDEVKGAGNSLDFGARIYDSRIGRWLSIDPLFRDYEAYSPYGFGLNNPTNNIDVGGGIVVDKNGNPVYTSQGNFKPKTDVSGVTRIYEHRVYYSNKGNEIHVSALIKKQDADGIDMEIQVHEQYICHGYTHLASIGNLKTPDESNHKVHFLSELSIDNPDGTTTVHKNTETILADDYSKLNIGDEKAREMAKGGEKVIGIWDEESGISGHSAIVSPEDLGHFMFLSKNSTEPFKPGVPYTKDRLSELFNLNFRGYYQHKGNTSIDVDTENGKTNMTTEEIKSKINN